MNRPMYCSYLPLGACALLFAAVFGTSCEQPPLLCEVASGAYAMKFFPKDSPNDCLGIPGELVGMSIYNPPKGDDREIDATRATIAIQLDSMGTLFDKAFAANANDPNSEHNLYAFGDYTARPNANELCSALNLAPAEQSFPRTDYTDAMGNPAVFPATRVVHAWNDMRVYVTFAAPGSAVTGEVTMMREVTDPNTGVVDTCTSTYLTIGLYPAVGCESASAAGMPDDSLCCANANPEAGRLFGSGIHPDFRTKCDPVLLQCVLDWAPGNAFPPLGGNPGCQ